MGDSQSPKRGALIVFEGLDKAGKSTQCARLEKSLSERGHPVKSVRFPNRTTPIGQMIDSYLRGASHIEDHAIHLLFSANRWEAANSIEADLELGTSILVDRYYYSGAVYSAAKQNPSLSLRWARRPDEGLPQPDACIFLYISPEDAAKRGDFGGEKYEKHEMQHRVRKMFAELQQTPDGEDFISINGGSTPEKVATEVLEVAQRMIDRVQSGNLLLRHAKPWP